MAKEEEQSSQEGLLSLPEEMERTGYARRANETGRWGGCYLAHLDENTRHGYSLPKPLKLIKKLTWSMVKSQLLCTPSLFNRLTGNMLTNVQQNLKAVAFTTKPWRLCCSKQFNTVCYCCQVFGPQVLGAIATGLEKPTVATTWPCWWIWKGWMPSFHPSWMCVRKIIQLM